MALPVDVAGLCPRSGDVEAPPKPGSSLSSMAEAEREGGRARRPETGVREVEIPRPSCSSRAQVGCACSRGLQAFHAGGSERPHASACPVLSPRGQPSLRGPWSFLL